VRYTFYFRDQGTEIREQGFANNKTPYHLKYQLKMIGFVIFVF